MARVEYGEEEIGRELVQLIGRSREIIQRTVDKGAETASELMHARTLAARHGPPGVSGRGTGAMLGSIGATEYIEFMGGGQREVYPLGEDSRGTRNATKAFVLNYGRGKSLRGDRFITGRINETKEKVRQAMTQEAYAALREAKGGR